MRTQNKLIFGTYFSFFAIFAALFTISISLASMQPEAEKAEGPEDALEKPPEHFPSREQCAACREALKKAHRGQQSLMDKVKRLEQVNALLNTENQALMQYIAQQRSKSKTANQDQLAIEKIKNICQAQIQATKEEMEQQTQRMQQQEKQIEQLESHILEHHEIRRKNKELIDAVTEIGALAQQLITATKHDVYPVLEVMFPDDDETMQDLDRISKQLAEKILETLKLKP